MARFLPFRRSAATTSAPPNDDFSPDGTVVDGTEPEKRHSAAFALSRAHPTRRRLTLYIIWISTFLSFCAFILQLLAALSLPVIKGIYLASIHAKTQANQPATAVATEIRVGVWGFCAISVLGDSTCIGPQLGYTLEPSIIMLVTNQVSLVNGVLKGLTFLLVLHPIAAVLCFLTFISSLFLANHPASILCLVLTVLTGLLEAVVLAADLALGLVARSKVPGLTDQDFTVSLGPAPWLIAASLALTWICVVLVSVRACVCWGVGRKHYRPKDY